MASEIALEIETLHQVVMDMLGDGDPLDFDHCLPLFSATLKEKQIESVRRGLEQKLVHMPGRAIPLVSVMPVAEEKQPPVLRVIFVARYLKDQSDKDWYVDIPTAACWHFKTASELSSSNLCRHWNEPHNRGYLESVRHEVKAERAALRLHLLNLRDSGIRVTQFGYKSDGIFEDL